MTLSFALASGGDHNLRDLGGMPRDGGSPTLPGRVLRGCALQGMDPAARDALVQAGLIAVIDLRTDAERAVVPSPFSDVAGVTTHHQSLFQDLAPAAAMMAEDPQFRLEKRYGRALSTSAPRFASVIRTIAEAPPGIVMFHCTAGKDRTGLVAALMLRLAGVTDAAIVDDYASTATRGAGLIARLRADLLARGANPDRVATILSCPHSAMRATLDSLDTDHGGARAYLRHAGLDDAVISAAAGRLG